MLFKNVVGQNEVKQSLVKTVQENHIHHAQMFLAPDGFGGLPLALAYAQYITCQDRQNDDACGICPACQKYQKLIHPDLHFVYPVPKVGNKASSDHFIEKWREMVLNNSYFTPNQWYQFIGVDNKQGMIHREESSSIIRRLNLKTFEAEYKIMIIWKPETLNIQAANTLLKILEEPPEKTLFILLAQDTERILPTILSRSQIIRLDKIDNNDMAVHLRQQFGIDEERLQNIVHLANGNFVDALGQINHNEENEFYFENFVSLMRMCYAKQVVDFTSWVDKMAGMGRERQKGFLSAALRLIRENFALSFQQPELVFLSEEESQFSQKFHQFINQDNVQGIADELNKAHFHIEMNGNSKIVLFDLGLKLVRLLHQKT